MREKYPSDMIWEFDEKGRFKTFAGDKLLTERSYIYLPQRRMAIIFDSTFDSSASFFIIEHRWGNHDYWFYMPPHSRLTAEYCKFRMTISRI